MINDVHLVPPGAPPQRWHNPYPSETAAERLQLGVRHLVDAGVEAIAALGDLTDIGDAANVERILAELAGAGVPVWIVPGNHDLTDVGSSLPASSGAVTVAPWAAADLGSVPVFGVEIMRDAGYRAVGLDALTPRGDGPAIVLSHFPVLSLSALLAEAELADAGNLANVDDLRRAVESLGGPTLVLHAHLHVRATSTAGNVLQLSAAALIEAPYEVAVIDLELTGERPTVRRTATSVWPITEERLPTLAPDHEAWAFSDGAWRPAE